MYRYLFDPVKMERVKKEADDAEKTFKDRIQKLELQRIELEEEISRLKANSATDRLHAEESLINTRQKLKAEEVLCQQVILNTR